MVKYNDCNEIRSVATDKMSLKSSPDILILYIVSNKCMKKTIYIFKNSKVDSSH